MALKELIINIDIPADTVIANSSNESILETRTVAADFSLGNMTINKSSNKILSQVIVVKPVTLLPENIKKGITIAGVLGTSE